MSDRETCVAADKLDVMAWPEPLSVSPFLVALVQDEIVALARFRSMTKRPTKDLLEFVVELTDGRLEVDDGVPPDVRVGAGFALGIVHAVACLVGATSEEVLVWTLRLEERGLDGAVVP